jgi:hypothetical protein
VHRDVKPGNLLLAEGGVKVADFGIARALDQVNAALTATGRMLGTSAYLAPELGRDMTVEAAGPESDVYALGCALYELLCGQPPFSGDAAAVVVYQHIDVPPPPRQLRADIPADVEALVLRMLAKRPTERPTATEVAEHLAALSSPAASATAGSPPPTDPLAVYPVSRLRRTRRTTVLTGTVAAAVFAASAVVGHQLFNDEAKAPATEHAPSSPSSSEPGAPAKRMHPRPTTSTPAARTEGPVKDAVGQKKDGAAEDDQKRREEAAKNAPGSVKPPGSAKASGSAKAPGSAEAPGLAKAPGKTRRRGRRQRAARSRGRARRRVARSASSRCRRLRARARRAVGGSSTPVVDLTDAYSLPHPYSLTATLTRTA